MEEIKKEEDKPKTEDKRNHRERTNNIINNNYNKVEIEINDISFKPIEVADENDLVDGLHYELIVNQIDSLIHEHSKFSKLNVVESSTKADGTLSQKNKSLKKGDANEILEYMSTNLKSVPFYDLYKSIAYYFDIPESKLFDMLSNVHKSKILKVMIASKQIISFNYDTKLH